MRDREDRLVDSFLEEVVGGQSPPDLSDRIVQALARQESVASEVEATGAGASAGFTPPAGPGQAAGGGLSGHRASIGNGQSPAGGTENAPASPSWPVSTPTSVTAMAARRRRPQSRLTLWASVAAAVTFVIAVSVYVATNGLDGDMPGPSSVATNDAPADRPKHSEPSSPDGDVVSDPSSDNSTNVADAVESIVPEEIKIDPSGRGPITPNGPEDRVPDVPRVATTSTATDQQMIALIDTTIRNRWEADNVSPSPDASDAAWCRRVYLDVLGRIPTLDELQRFVTGRDSGKKAELVDQLLDSEDYTEEYARNWTTIWTNILIGRSGGTNRRSLVNRQGLQQYLRRSFQRNKPYDRMVLELVSAKGVNKPGEEGYNGAVNFVLDNLQENATTATAKTSRYFLGLQVQCTQCHNHPFNDWKQNQFWELNSFFRQANALRTREGRNITHVELIDEDFAGQGSTTPEEAEIYFELRNGLMEVAYPVFVDGRTIARQGWVSDVNRRDELAKLIVTSEYLGQAIVNRMWAHFLGYGFTKPIDDMGPHNPPSHPELLNRLANEFAGGGHDLKRLMRWITLSKPYSLSSSFGARYKNAKDDPAAGETPLFSHFYLRQMRAEELYESLLVATAAHKTRGSYVEQESLKSQWLSQFTIAFGTDEGDEMTTFNGSIPQTLMMMNGDLIKKATSSGSGSFLHTVASIGQSNAKNIDHLYMAALARRPSKPELALANQLLVARDGDAASALEDIWWAVLNSNEFILNH